MGENIESLLNAGLLGARKSSDDRMGDCTNIEIKVNPKSILWTTVYEKSGWILQKEKLTNRARIVNSFGVQKGNGSLKAMKEKMDRLLSVDFLRPGDVIGVDRGAYEHYGIYVGNGKVIHYAGEGSDFFGRISIHEASMEGFLKKSKDYFVLFFEDKYPVKIHSTTNFLGGGFLENDDIRTYRCFSPEETLARAYSRIGEEEYSLIINNCEHFAMWCKTGVSASTQVKRVVRYVLGSGISLAYISESKDDLVSYLL